MNKRRVLDNSCSLDLGPLDWASVRLTPLEEGDLELIYLWQNAPDIRDLTMGFRFPVQRDSAKEWLKSVREENSASRVVYAIRKDSSLAGVIQLHNIDAYQRRALLGVFIGKTQERHRGTGSVSTALLLDYAFNGLDFRKVSLEVFSANFSAVRLYEKLGFVREGVKREDYFLDGKYFDTLLFGMLRAEFRIAIPKEANRLIASVHSCKT
jgi:UDP-4-amino-4,6-dideoxy-N-acetyl-beta-L-altrosamine N-acetyltransferase